VFTQFKKHIHPAVLTPNEVAAFPTVLKLQSVASKALKAKYPPIPPIPDDMT
jgi:hypothetical protein